MDRSGDGGILSSGRPGEGKKHGDKPNVRSENGYNRKITGGKRVTESHRQSNLLSLIAIQGCPNCTWLKVGLHLTQSNVSAFAGLRSQRIEIIFEPLSSNNHVLDLSGTPLST